MSVPQVNAGATDRNREQTKRICELLGYQYKIHDEGTGERLQPGHRLFSACHPSCDGGDHIHVQLKRESFTLDQAVGMLEAEDVAWLPGGGWYQYEGHTLIWNSPLPHDLTAAMDALIKILEIKHGEAR